MARMNMPSLILPPGFRFHPTDEELINHYLKKKASSSSSSSSDTELSIIANINIYKFNPWELPGKALFGENEWFFFSPRDRKYPNGGRPNRTAASGYWKATGTDKPILSSNGSQCLGVKKSLVFYKGRAPKGIKTNWMMLEYRLLDDNHQLQKLRGSMRLDDWVLCRIRRKNSNLKEKEETYESSCGSSLPFSVGCLQGQEAILEITNMALKDYDYDFEACLKSEDTDGQAEYHEGSPGNSFSAVDSDSHQQPAAVSSLKEALESIKKVLFVGAFEELMPVPVPPTKRLHVSTSNNAENSSIFQVSSPTISPPYPQSFSEFMI